MSVSASNCTCSDVVSLPNEIRIAESASVEDIPASESTPEDPFGALLEHADPLEIQKPLSYMIRVNTSEGSPGTTQVKILGTIEEVP